MLSLLELNKSTCTTVYEHVPLRLRAPPLRDTSSDLSSPGKSQYVSTQYSGFLFEIVYFENIAVHVHCTYFLLKRINSDAISRVLRDIEALPVSDFGLNTTIELPGQRRLFCTIVTFLDDTYHFTRVT